MRGGARQFAALTMAFESWFVIALIALHLLRPDLAPSRTMISRYAVGPHGRIAVVGLLTSAVFPMDVPPASATLAGRIHEASFVVNVPCSLLAALLLSTSFGSDVRWRPFWRTAWALTLSEVVAFVLQVVTMAVRSNYGVANKVFVASAVTLVFAIALRMRTISRT